MKIVIRSIDHKNHRYDSVGDYWFKKDALEIRVSKMANPDYEFLVAVHELVESYITNRRGIREPDIMAFDIALEERCKKGTATKDDLASRDDPGFHPDAPYIKEHTLATNIEKAIAGELGINWKDYEKALEEL